MSSKMRNSVISRHILLGLLLASLLPFLMVTSLLTRYLGILVCLYMSRSCWKSALSRTSTFCVVLGIHCHCDGTQRRMCLLCRQKLWFQRSWTVNPIKAYQQFTREINKPPSNTVLPDLPMQAMRDTDVGIKCPLMHKYIVSGTYDHNGGKITIPKDAISKGDSVTFYTVVDLCGPFVFPLRSRTNLASPYYWIGVTGSYHFQKLVQVEFEHFAVITDPSHFQLLSCKDDDDSYTMQPVDYDFKLQGSSCTFKTCHFCSYCLHYYKLKGKEPITDKNRIGVFYLKPKNYQSLSSFTVEILFSYTTSHCLCRLKELCEKKGMMIDTNCSELFDASCDKNSTSFFTLEYDDDINGWHIDHSRAKDLVIETKKINFYNDYADKEELHSLEELSFFPPRFILNIKNVEHQRTTDLYTKFTVTLYNNANKRKLLKTITLELSVPVSRSASTKDSASISNDLYPLPTISDHPCGINRNKPEYINLIKYADVVAPHWEDVAIYLGIPNEKIPVIKLDHPYAQKKCKKMFEMWLERTELPCWCHFIQALCNVGLVAVAGKIKKSHFYGSPNAAASTEDNLKATNNKINLREVFK